MKYSSSVIIVQFGYNVCYARFVFVQEPCTDPSCQLFDFLEVGQLHERKDEQ